MKYFNRELLQTMLAMMMCQIMLVLSAYGTATICGTGNQVKPAGNSQVGIERTFLKTEKRNFSRSPGGCIDPDLAVSIDSQTLAELFVFGTRRIHWETDSIGISTYIDVGYAVDDTQFWSFPSLPFVQGYSGESVDPNSSPTIDYFPGTNYVFKALNLENSNTYYVHYQLGNEDLFQLGYGIQTPSDTFLADWFETEAFLPVECGWTIEETITTTFDFAHDIDSIVEFKHLAIHSTGMMTPPNEEPVPAVLAYMEYDYAEWKDGAVVVDTFFDAFIWFSEEGHRMIGHLAEGSPIEGMAEFTFLQYEKNIPPCAVNLDLGIDPFAGTFNAQNKITSGATINNGPVQLVASHEIELKPGFSTDKEFEAIINSDPCNY